MKENPLNTSFLRKILERIKNGDFDAYLNLPFMSRELFYSTIKNKIQIKLDTGGTPLLTDNEVKDCIADTKEAAVNIFGTFLKEGFIIKDAEFGFKLTPKGELAIKASRGMIKL